MTKGIQATVLVLACVAIAGVAVAQEGAGELYRLGPGDVLQLSVWQSPDLDRELRVRDDGTIVVPLVGEIPAEGNTIPELESLLARRLRSFNRDITEVSLQVVAYNSFEVFVMGAVASPGRLSFDYIPNVWDAVRAAGGPLPTANLRRVRVLRPLDGGTNTIVINLERVVRGDSGSTELPEIRAGDTIIVPDNARLSAADREQGVHVLGAVNSPGLYPVEDATPLMTLVLQAGGFGGNADLSDIKWVHPTPEGPVRTRKVNVRLFLDNGQVESNPLIEAGDTIYVERGLTRPSLLQALTASTSVIALILNLVRN